VARGYRRAPAETAKRFLVRDGVRWYRTGDRGRYWPDGTLEFLGRIDFQVKVRGHRIELGEIEAAIGRYPAVERSVAFTTMGENRVIAAAVVPRPAETIDEREMTRFLAHHLPASMIPDAFVTVPVLPLTANGKIDREALTRLISSDKTRDLDDPPRGPTEEAVASLWVELLGLPSVGRARSFFALGGNSLLATQLVDTLRRRTGVVVSLRELFTHATVAELAAAIDGSQLPVGADEGVV
jgi:acyl carrier protein